MKYTFFLLLFFLITSCGSRSGKTDQALIRTLSKAITVLEEKNTEHFKKLESKYLADTNDLELKTLYKQFLIIQQSKTEYKQHLLKEENLNALSRTFIEKCLAQLNESEKKKIKKTFEQSLLLDSGAIDESDRSEVLRYELMLEAEEIVREIQLLLLKDLNVRKPSFDWEYYWEK